MLSPIIEAAGRFTEKNKLAADFTTNPIALQAGIKLITQLYYVTHTERVIKYLRREPELILVLLEAHYLARQYFDNGLRLELTMFYKRSYEELIITVNIPDSSNLEDELEILSEFVSELPLVPSANYSFTLAKVSE